MEPTETKSKAHGRRQYRRRKANQIKVATSATLVLPPLSLSLEEWMKPNPSPAFTLDAPVTVSFGNPKLEVDIRGLVNGTVRFVKEHPMLSVAIAAVAIYLVYNLPDASYQQT
ncbi:MAG: hypothetical protein LAP61_29420 [Acidobacteriia bacterium]|nr:hypothetical protein [Terriglobia bacterium]